MAFNSVGRNNFAAGVTAGNGTLLLDGNLTTIGGNDINITTTGATNITFPTSGTLATTDSSSNFKVTLVPSPSYNVQLNDCIVGCEVSSTPATPFDVVLPSAAPSGQVMYIKDYTGQSAVNQINVTAGSSKIDGNPSGAIIFTAYACQGYFSDGTDWFTL
jgi:hypothetical protein